MTEANAIFAQTRNRFRLCVSQAQTAANEGDRHNGLDDALKKLAKALKRVERSESRTGRRNARRAVFGSLRSLRTAVDGKYPVIPKPRKSEPKLERLDAAAQRLHWRGFEEQMITKVPDVWDGKLAEGFNEWISVLDGHPAKPIVFDIREMGDRRRLLGLHTPDQIRLVKGIGAKRQWQVLLHEIAHYRWPDPIMTDRWNSWVKDGCVGEKPPKPGRSHAGGFTLELCRVYKLWLQYRGL